MKKLLHERLRGWVEKSKEEDRFPATIALEETFEYDFYDAKEQERKLFVELADEIERYYIPRPRFEDGEPCNVGDEVEFPQPTGKQKILSFIAGEDGIQLANVGLHTGPVMIYANMVKRPSIKVLDADGVEIKVGDTVYGVNTGVSYEVTLLDRNDCGHVCLKNDDGQHWYATHGITHKEPDSLEKLRDDVLRWMARYSTSTPYETVESIGGEIADRLSELIKGAES